jgi:hypothetical protein
MKLPLISTKSAWTSVLKQDLLKEKLEPSLDLVFARRRYSTSSIQKEIWKLLEKRPQMLTTQN